MHPLPDMIRLVVRLVLGALVVLASPLSSANWYCPDGARCSARPHQAEIAPACSREAGAAEIRCPMQREGRRKARPACCQKEQEPQAPPCPAGRTPCTTNCELRAPLLHLPGTITPPRPDAGAVQRLPITDVPQGPLVTAPAPTEGNGRSPPEERVRRTLHGRAPPVSARAPHLA